MEKLKENRGITLISLIITIIVMLILVAVTINVVINSGLIGKTKSAGEGYKTATEEESKMGEITVGDKTYGEIEDYIKGNYILPEKAGTKFETTGEYSDGKNTAVIPAGFTVSGARGEETIDEGLVIYLINDMSEEEIEAINWEDATTLNKLQTTYDQFVWIPISHTQINDMYMCQSEGTDTDGNGTVDDDEYKSCNIKVQEVEGEEVAYCTTHNSTQMAGRLYATETEDNFNARLTTQTYTAGSGLREPDTISYRDKNSTYLGYLSDILEPGVATENKVYTSETNFKAKLQEEYNEVVKSVYKNEGFYVGRYETSNFTTTSGTAVKVVKGTTNGINNINWYYMYAQQVKYVANNTSLSEDNVGSTMIQGAAYDQVMNFVNTDDYDVTSYSSARHTGDIANTGANLNDKVKNIYDLEGNVRALTTEARSTERKRLPM